MGVRGMAWCALLACLGCGEPAVAPVAASPAPVVAPPAPPAAPLAEPVAEPALPHVLAWRFGTFEQPSVLLAVPMFPSTPEEALPDPWGIYLSRVRRVALVLDEAQTAAYLAPHQPGTARTSLRRTLGDADFALLLQRLSARGEVNAAILDATDPVFAGLALGLLELGFEDPNDDMATRLSRWAEVHHLPVLSLLDASTYARLEPPDAMVLGGLREALAEPTRMSTWLTTARAAYAAADPAAMLAACDEPERTAAWDVDGRARLTALATALTEPAAAALTEAPTLVAINACVLLGEGRLLEALRARGLELTPLHETE